MKIMVVAAALLAQAIIMDSAFAQQQQSYTLTVTAQEAIQIMNALSNQPYKDVYNLIGKVSNQVAAQQQQDPPK